MDLSVIIVSWNVCELLRRCLQSVYRSLDPRTLGDSPLTFEVFVVDNASRDGSLSMLRREFPEVRVVANERNLGFTAANNQALRLASGRYLLLLNPDTEVVGDALPRLVKYMEEHPEVGVVAPQLLYPDGGVQPSRRRFPTRLTGLIESTPLQRVFRGSDTLRRYYVSDVADDQEQEVDWVVGACFLVRATTTREVGFFDERYFMYSEELDWCYRIKTAGWRVTYLPNARVIHYEARSSEQDVLARDIYFHESKCLFYGKAFGPAFGLFLRFFILATFLCQVFEEFAKLVLMPRRRTERWQRLRHLTRVVGWQSCRLLAVLFGKPGKGDVHAESA